MKKVYLKNIAIIIVLIVSLFTGSFNYSVNCVSVKCCKTECCEENPVSSDSDLSLILDNADCCEYAQSLENKILATTSPNTNIVTTLPSILFCKIYYYADCKYYLSKFSLNPVRESHSVSVLRI